KSDLDIIDLFFRVRLPSVVARRGPRRKPVKFYPKTLSLALIFALALLCSAACNAASSKAPKLFNQPNSQAIEAGTTVTFTVGVHGDEPLNYQWRFNATPMSGATASSLTLTQAQCSASGAYSVVVTNQWGSDTSADATLTVTDTVAPVI